MTNGGAYTQGYLAFKDGVIFSECPHARQSDLWKWWRAGWVDAFNKKAVENSGRKVG